ncbi:MAG: helix-turn-helix transcriptional regulator [Thermoplasmata archaeon]
MAEGNRGADASRRTELSEAFQALGSDARLRILQQLMRGDCSVSELARAMSLHPVTIRYHVNILLRDGLVEQLSHHREGAVGRPTTRYRIRYERMIGGFPPRHYEVLSEILLQTITESLARDRWERALYAAGRESGRQLIEAIEKDAQVSVWNPKRFVHLYMEGALANLGMQTEVVELRDDSVQYRAFTCPFQELALKYPDKICDYLDVGFHEGIAEKLGTNVVHERLACMGHGDPHCEYCVRWTEPSHEEAG